MVSRKFFNLDVDKKLAELSLAEKLKLLGGKDFWAFEDVPGKGIPSVRTSDGPNGVRGRNFFNGVPSSCFPCGTGLAASFDVEMVQRVGEALGDECIAKSAHVLLGPTVNIQRSPLGGRGFESYSEDPTLSGLVAAAYINGVQSKGVAAAIKHFVANDQEFERFSSSSEVSQRALREIYLEPFRLAVKHSNPKAFMTAYNRVNGLHCSEDENLIDAILRGEWGWKGLVMSDWTGVYSVDKSIKAGLDVEMPGPPVMRNAANVARVIGAGKLAMNDIDARVRTVLEMVNYAIDSQIPFYGDETKVDTPELRALLREAAANATVVLKNDAKLLPLGTAALAGKKIAIIGSNAKLAFPSGGGSASLNASWVVSPYEAITFAAKEAGAAAIDHAIGVASFRYVPICDPYLSNARIDFYSITPPPHWFNRADTAPKQANYSIETSTSNAFLIGTIPWEKLGLHVSTRYTATFTPDVSGPWTFGLGSIGDAVLFVDGQRIVDNTNPTPGELFFAMGSTEVYGDVELEAGRPYRLELHGYANPEAFGPSPFSFKASFRIGAFPKSTPRAMREEAVELASNSDLAIVVVGTNPDWESEGFDRKSMKLPGETNALVRAVLRAQPNTIVVNQSGTPVELPWVDEAATLVHTFFGGNELGNGLADVLFGKVCAAGRLPLTFPVRLEDNPSFNSFGVTSDTPGKVFYGEGIYVGYRHYDRLRLAPAFPFGFGLSYTTFAFDSLNLSPPTPSGDFTVSFRLANTGERDGAEVAQVYISAPSDGSHIASPVKELKAFHKVSLEVGASKDVVVKLSREAFSYWNEAVSSWVAPAGVYRVLVATSSAEEDIKLDDTVHLEQEIRWNGL